PRLRLHPRPAPCRPPRRARGVADAGPAGHAAGAHRTPPVSPAGRIRRGVARILPAPVPRQGGRRRSRVGHRGLQQPRSPEPLAQPRVQPGGARSPLCRRTALAPAAPRARGLRTGRPGAHAAVATVARGHPAPALPLPAPLSRLGRPPSRAYAQDCAAASRSRSRAMTSTRTRTMRQRWSRIAVGAFALVVAVLLVRYARGIDWRAVAEALAGLDAATLWRVAALAVLSFLTYG